MSNIPNSALVRLGTSADFPPLEPLWIALYEDQKTKGMLVELPEGAFEKWTASLDPILDRFACLFVAEIDNEPVGFLAGRVRSLPPYFGGSQVGFISDVFVSEFHRGQGLGRKLVQLATDWFRNLGLSRIELQVIVNNNSAREVYRKLGWSEELVQMVLVSKD